MHVADILTSKGSAVVTVSSGLRIDHLAQRLKLEGIGAAVVSEDGVTIEGIISERDLVRGLAEHGAELTSMTVGELMTKAVVTCSPDDSISHVSRLMTKRRIRHVPVVDKHDLVGIVSIGDVVRHRLEELELETNVLRDYAVSRH
jgi:CBS domain-containing protein